MSTKDVSDAEVVRAAVKARSVGSTTLNELTAITGQPRKVCFRAIERAVERGFVEFGVSVETAWPTEKGISISTGPCNCGNSQCPGCYPS